MRLILDISEKIKDFMNNTTKKHDNTSNSLSLENPYETSMFTWLTGSLGMLCGGTVIGVGIAMRHMKNHENFQFNMAKHRTPVMMATRALMYGTALSIGSFGVGMASFLYITDIKTPQEFALYMKKTLKPFETPATKDPLLQKEIELVSRLDEEHQLKYLWSQYFTEAHEEVDKRLKEDEEEFIKNGGNLDDLRSGKTTIDLEKIINKKDRTISEQMQYINEKYIKSLFR